MGGKERKTVIGCVIMASGFAKRFGSNKLLELLDGRPLVSYVWRELKDLEGIHWVLDPVVVTRFPEIADLAEADGISCVLHRDPFQSDTIRHGLKYGADRWEGCFFLSGDQPLVRPESIRAMSDAFISDPGQIYRLSWAGRPEKPVLFPKSEFPALMQLAGDAGGSQILKQSDVVCIEAVSGSEMWDVDRPEDLARIRSLFHASLPQSLGIPSGITAVIGSGGKTTLLRRLAEELEGSVILCTSTHILPFAEWPLVLSKDEIAPALKKNRVICTGTPAEKGKLTAPPLSFSELAEYADYVLVEADGSAGRPLKAHAFYEPVIPQRTGLIICVTGASGFGGRICDVVHRPEIFCELTGAEPQEIAEPGLAARALRKEGLADVYILNQIDTVSGSAVRSFRDAMKEKTFALQLEGKKNQ